VRVQVEVETQQGRRILSLFGHQLAHRRQALENALVMRGGSEVSGEIFPGLVTKLMSATGPQIASGHVIHYAAKGYVGRASLLPIALLEFIFCYLLFHVTWTFRFFLLRLQPSKRREAHNAVSTLWPPPLGDK
jgi:hypothetical protein